MEKELNRRSALLAGASVNTPTGRASGWISGLTACLIAALSPLTATAQAVEPQVSDELQTVGLQTLYDADGSVLAWNNGRHIALPLAKGSRLGQPRTVGSRWWVSANEPHADGNRIVLIQGEGAEIVDQSVVHSAPGKALFASQPVVDPHGLQAVMWLEGTEVRTSEVRYALRRRDAWSAPETLSPRGAGTQTALSVVTLDDGTWLATWTAFDGDDSDVLWSRYQLGAWSAPTRLGQDNPVPDITPRLLAVDGGALVAWSRYDGHDYRLMVAHFDPTQADHNTDDAGPWSTPQMLGDPGTLYPEWTAAAQPLLAFRQAVPAGWTVLRLDPQGHPQAKAHLPTQAQEAPILLPKSSTQLTVRWLDLDRQTNKLAPTEAALTWQPLP